MSVMDFAAHIRLPTVEGDSLPPAVDASAAQRCLSCFCLLCSTEVYSSLRFSL